MFISHGFHLLVKINELTGGGVITGDGVQVSHSNIFPARKDQDQAPYPLFPHHIFSVGFFQRFLSSKRFTALLTVM
jgi:hypothetical protein